MVGFPNNAALQVVCSLNWEEDMSAMVEKLDPFRWKVFQVLVVAGENENGQRKRDATKFVISDEQYEEFCRKHRHLKCFVPEPNSAMKSSYLVWHSSPVALLCDTDSVRSSTSTCASWTREMAMRRSPSRFWMLVYRRLSSRFDGIKRSFGREVVCMNGRSQR